MTAAPENGKSTSRCVVYGEYPPFRGPASSATLATVRTLLADGRVVEVVSPRPSAAHHHADVARPSGAAALARHVGGGEVVACLDSGILAGAPGRRAAAARAILGLTLRRARRVEVRLSPLPPAPDRGWVRAVLGPAARVVTASPADGRALADLGIRPGRIVTAEDDWWSAAPTPAAADAPDAAGLGSDDPVGDDGTVAARGAEPWHLGAQPSREQVEAEVRRRAERDRDTESTSPVAASWPLHLLTPLALAPVQSSKPLFRLVKQFVHRLVAWEVVPIVEQVNHLQRATIEAVDRLSADAQPDGSGRAGGPTAASS